jgi:molybdopterin converting factor small subunit
MFISIKLYGNMAVIAEKDILTLEIEEESSLKDVLYHLIDIYGEEMKLELVEMRSEQFSPALILINKETMPLISNLDRIIYNGDKIYLISFCAGG